MHPVIDFRASGTDSLNFWMILSSLLVPQKLKNYWIRGCQNNPIGSVQRRRLRMQHISKGNCEMTTRYVKLALSQGYIFASLHKIKCRYSLFMLSIYAFRTFVTLQPEHPVHPSCTLLQTFIPMPHQNNKSSKERRYPRHNNHGLVFIARKMRLDNFSRRHQRRTQRSNQDISHAH